MMKQRLKSHIWVSAFLKRQETEGRMALVVRSGDADAGSVFIRHYVAGQGCMVYAPVTDADGTSAWMRATGPTFVSEQEADAYLARQYDYDADLWVVEVDDPKATFLMEGRILEDDTPCP